MIPRRAREAERVVIEFTAVVDNLTACFDAVLQEINSAPGLGLVPLAKKGSTAVTFRTVRDALRDANGLNSFPGWTRFKDLNSPEWEWWIRFRASGTQNPRPLPSSRQ